MSFHDVSKRWRDIIEKRNKESLGVEEPQTDEKEESSPKSLVEHINGALTDHERDRNILKERGLVENSNTVRRYTNPRKRRTAFSKLNDEIVQFQKMVNEFRRGTMNEFMTPEDQWRFQILLKSVQEMDTSLAQQIENGPWREGDGVVNASFSKLTRDYERIHKAYKRILDNYMVKQRAEISFLSRDNEEKFGESAKSKRRNRGSPHHNDDQMRVLETEDFFDRTMREREDEMKNINQKVHIVNNIFEDLGKLVNDQQEQIDKVEENIIETTTYTEEGLEQLQRKKGGGICDPENRQKPEPINERLSWRTPFQTLGKDIHDVGGDLVDLMKSSTKKLKDLKNSRIFECSPGEAFSRSRIFQCGSRDNIIIQPSKTRAGSDATDIMSYDSLEEKIRTVEIRPYPTRTSRRKPH